MIDGVLTIGALSERTGVAPSALRYYEDLGLITAARTAAGQRRYSRHTIRRVSFVRAAQQVGLSLDEIGEALATLPTDHAPSEKDWSRVASSWRPRLDAQIAMIERLRDRLDGCIGCGCLSMKACRLVNPGDEAGARGSGPRFVLEDD